MDETEILDDVAETKKLDTEEVKKYLEEQEKAGEDAGDGESSSDSDASSENKEENPEGKTGKRRLKPVWKDLLEMFLYFVGV